jgi:hypothetical protein
MPSEREVEAAAKAMWADEMMPGGVANRLTDEFWSNHPDEDFEAEDNIVIPGRNTWRRRGRAALSAAEAVRKEKQQ